MGNFTNKKQVLQEFNDLIDMYGKFKVNEQRIHFYENAIANGKKSLAEMNAEVAELSSQYSQVSQDASWRGVSGIIKMFFYVIIWTIEKLKGKNYSKPNHGLMSKFLGFIKKWCHGAKEKKKELGSILLDKQNRCDEKRKSIDQYESELKNTKGSMKGCEEIYKAYESIESEIQEMYSDASIFKFDEAGTTLEKCLDKSIEIAIIPKKVKIIKQHAFDDCNLLHTVILNNVKELRAFCFDRCQNLKNIDLSGVQIFGQNCLAHTAIEEAAVCNTVFGMFSFCKELRTVTITSPIEKISSQAFEYCSKLEEFIIPDSVKSIDNDAFYGCKGITSITIPKDVTSIGSEAFKDCTSLRQVIFDGDIDKIEMKKAYDSIHGPFEGCINLNDPRLRKFK